MRLREKAPTIFLYSITVIVLILMIFFIDPEKIIKGFLKLGILGILILVILYLIDLMVRVFRWKLLLQVQGVFLPFKSLIMPVVLALAINLYFPARSGETVRLLSLKRKYGVNYSDTLSSIIIEQVLSIIGLLFVITGSLFVIGSSLQMAENSLIIQQLVLLLFLVSAAGLIGIWFAIIKPTIIEGILNLFPRFLEGRLKSMYRSFQAGINDLRSSYSTLSLGIITSASIWIIEGIMLFIIAVGIFSSYGIGDIPWIIAASCAGNITFILPILPGAMGQYEFVVGIILVNAPGYSAVGEGALSISFIDRIIKSAILFILGAYATRSLEGIGILRLRKDFLSTIKGQNNSNNNAKKNNKADLEVDSIQNR
ncbi:MAG: lysylphosphatidylglycerol synthase transmembrane domain-containing protein [Candidatus Hodarchaeales archaeon]|jgi:uncharacterized protein (TIRG00374 family)